MNNPRTTRHRTSPRLQIVSAVLLVTALVAVQFGCNNIVPNTETSTPEIRGTEKYVDGVMKYNAGDKDKAVEDFLEAVRENPDLRMAHAMLGDIYRNQGDYQSALVHYENAARLDPYTVASHYNLGLTYQFLSRLSDAATSYKKALKLDEKDVKSNMNLGLVYLSSDQIPDSIKYLKKATELDPNNAEAWSNYGVCLDASGDATGAEQAYRKSLELDSNSVATLQSLGSNLITQNKLQQALPILEKVIQRSDTPAVRKRYADALQASNQFDLAVAQYDLVLTRDPNYLPATNEKAFTLIKQWRAGLEMDDAKRNAAVALLQKSLTVNPSQPRVREALEKVNKPGLFGN